MKIKKTEGILEFDPDDVTPKKKKKIDKADKDFLGKKSTKIILTEEYCKEAAKLIYSTLRYEKDLNSQRLCYYLLELYTSYGTRIKKMEELLVAAKEYVDYINLKPERYFNLSDFKSFKKEEYVEQIIKHTFLKRNIVRFKGW